MKDKQTYPKKNGNPLLAAPQSPGKASLLPQVRFEFSDGAAEKVFVAGTFNDWRPDATAMAPAGAGKWVLDLALPPGTYEYQLVVDGVWRLDPTASDSVPNPFGSRNSLLQVGTSA